MFHSGEAPKRIGGGGRSPMAALARLERANGTMAAIFISHSSQDRKVAAEMMGALERLGFERVFLDFDKTTGLGIGDNWEKRLYEELTRCHAVVLMLTPAWLASKWCFAELTQARALGKVILPVICEPLGEQFVLPHIQAVDLVNWNADGLERIEQRLRAIGNELARGFTLDPNRPPYPGIYAFEAEDAAVYFGRDEETRAVIERLDARRIQGGARCVVIIGASGSGKSSLLKASVLPQLRRRRPQWVLLPHIRPEKAPMEALAKALAQCGGKPEAWRQWHETLAGPAAVEALAVLTQDWGAHPGCILDHRRRWLACQPALEPERRQEYQAEAHRPIRVGVAHLDDLAGQHQSEQRPQGCPSLGQGERRGDGRHEEGPRASEAHQGRHAADHAVRVHVLGQRGHKPLGLGRHIQRLADDPAEKDALNRVKHGVVHKPDERRSPRDPRPQPAQP
jgi:hypothetical protein